MADKQKRGRSSEAAGRSQPIPVVPVVGICSSAGGLDALKRFFGAVPGQSGVAYVVVPHLDPNHESLMVELLAKHTAMPVAEVQDGTVVQADRVHVIPPNRSLSIERGVLSLSRAEVRGGRTAIDAFLRSLARDQRERAIAVVLSGTGSHGSLGIREIKLAGGMVMAQDPASADFDAMPRNAIATGTVDYVLRPEQMPAALLDYVSHPCLVGEREPVESDGELDKLNRVLAILRARAKFDFRCYRKNMLLRRVKRRMALCHIEDLADYEQHLRGDPDEVAALSKDLLIGVTAFFREAEALRVLEQRVLPELVQRVPEDAPIRVWIPACATGEEAYSIGMLLIEAFEAARRAPSMQIFATDVDETALDVARHGVYPDSIANDVPAERLRRFFVKSGENGYQVTKQLRDSIAFAQQNLVADAPFSRIHLISCRNLLIYLEPELQAKVIPLLHFSLGEDGYLLLGPSESIGRQTGLFETVSKKWRVYRRVGPARHDLLDIPLAPAAPRLATLASAAPSSPAPAALGQRFSELAQRVLLADYAPATVLVDRRFQVLHFHGPMVDYLEFPNGQPSNDLLAMSRPGLRTRLRAAMHGAAEKRDTVVDDGARVKRDGDFVPCRITVKPVRDSRDAGSLFLISFEDRAETGASGRARTHPPPAAPRAHESEVVEQLERELTATREDLQSTIEEFESSSEELKASNEEIMSMNEELQSTNEELETSKEELQSMNEERNTVNAELQSKLQDLEEVHNDISNFLASTDIATLFLDVQMRIKRFTPPIGRLLNLITTDVGRPISAFSAKVANDSLVTDARRVVERLTPVETEVWSEEPGQGCCYIRRIVPYRTGDNRIDGVVVTFIDITARKRAEEELETRVAERTSELRANRSLTQSIVDTVVDAIVTIDARGIIALFNPSAERMFGYRADEVVGKNVKMLMPAPFSNEHDGYLLAYLRTGVAKIIGIGREVVGQRKDGSTFPIHLAVAEMTGDGPRRFVGTMRDLTAVQRARQELEREHALSESVLSTARVIVMRLDEQGRVLSFNPYMEELCGFPLEEVRGKDWFTTFIPERERARLQGVFERAIRGHGSRGVINPILTRDGAEVLVEWYDATLHVPGEPLSLIAIGQDVTARDKLEKEYLQAQKMEAVGRLAAGVAHDVNNLLAGIIGGVRIASKGLGPDHPARRVLEQVQNEVERGSSITRRLLDFSRVGRARPTWVDPRESLAAGERMIRRFIGEDIDVRVVCDSSGSRVYGDPGQIEQAVLNLAINARDAMPRGGRLEIRCADVQLSAADVERLGGALDPGPHTILSVEDTGCGMNEETRTRAVEAFFTTKETGLGTGLGLSSVSTMMQQCGGHLAIESELGTGTRVRMIFPRPSAGAAEPATSAAVSPPLGGSPPPGGEERILLVEDETLVRLGVQHILGELGYTVTAAKDPTAALGELETSDRPYDLLLTDVILPGMSGPELAAAVRKEHPEMRVLLMSAFPAEELVAQGRIAAKTPTLEKPFTDEQLARRIREALASRGDESREPA